MKQTHNKQTEERKNSGKMKEAEEKEESQFDISRIFKFEGYSKDEIEKITKESIERAKECEAIGTGRKKLEI